jgi:hypothetical protein
MSEGRTLEMKMAKASEDDLKRVESFFEWLEEFVDYGTNAEFKSEDDEGEEDSEGRILHDEQVIERIRMEFSRFTRRATVAGSWRRVIWGMRILLENCCDPDATTLEWNPELKALIEAADSPSLEPHPFTADAWQLQETANA